jgi:hypothetical protein
MIILRERALRIQTRLLKTLTNELCLTVIHLLSRTPTEQNGWKTPIQAVTSKKPPMAHLRLVGSKANARKPHLAKGDKLESQVLTGRLLSFDASIIYRVWLPGGYGVVRTRGVLSEPRTAFKNLRQHAALSKVARVLDIDNVVDVQGIDVDEVIKHAGLMRGRGKERIIAGHPLISLIAAKEQITVA